MKWWKTHFAPNRQVNTVACGEPKAGLLTDNPLQVTCRRCQRTASWQSAMKFRDDLRGIVNESAIACNERGMYIGLLRGREQKNEGP